MGDGSCPMNQGEVVEAYFIEHRAKLIDIAAFFDRFDRAAEVEGQPDFRMTALRDAVKILLEDEPGRAARVLSHFSDHSTEPIESAAGLKGAFGANPD